MLIVFLPSCYIRRVYFYHIKIIIKTIILLIVFVILYSLFYLQIEYCCEIWDNVYEDSIIYICLLHGRVIGTITHGGNGYLDYANELFSGLSD